MKTIRIAGLLFLALLWLWLAWAVLRGGFNLPRLLMVVMSGIIVFVPLWRKYISGDSSDKK